MALAEISLTAKMILTWLIKYIFMFNVLIKFLHLKYIICFDFSHRWFLVWKKPMDMALKMEKKEL